MLQPFIDRYSRDLNESVIPFWLKYSLDTDYGGYLNCLDRDGLMYDSKKYMWLQGRAVWMFSRLYNQWQRKQEYLDAATLGIDFIRRYGRDPKGRFYFSLTREGQPFFYQRKPYAAVFCCLALLEYGQATGERVYLNDAVEIFWRVVEWIRRPELMDRPVLAGQPMTSNLANVMVLASLAIELLQVREDPRFRQVIRDAMQGVVRHYDPQRRILVENVPMEGTSLLDWPEGRLFNPGHSIEVAWFLLHMLELEPDPALRELALDAIEGSLECGWDAEYGGLYYLIDIEGRPTLQLESTMKLWWPHTEAIYALVLAYCLTREDRWLSWLQKVHDYAYAHFADPEYGEWFGYCDRRGELTHTCKGGSYKGFFHVPRSLLFSIQRWESSKAGSSH
jgi:N-acylglucosamine 2-epimerase